MSKLVTFEQAKRLKELGFHNDVLHFYKDDGGLYELEYFDREWSFGISSILDDRNYYKGEYNAPSISEALDWFREEKRVRCAVSMHTHSGNCDFVYYISYYSCSIQNTIVKDRFKTYSEAESALLDALIEYVL